MQAALALEKSVNQSLLELHKVAGSHGDSQVATVNPRYLKVEVHFKLLISQSKFSGPRPYSLI